MLAGYHVAVPKADVPAEIEVEAVVGTWEGYFLGSTITHQSNCYFLYSTAAKVLRGKYVSWAPAPSL